ncbi:MAG TPA: 50S ribosomal protein L3 [Clostridia bacterium]|nr:50S ribosomal protein L3 [Clostridia bacterium]
MNTITAIKGEMQTLFDESGRALPVTLVFGKEVKLEEKFSQGDLITISGISKGKGFAGVMKKHGFAGGPATHGQSDRPRAPGSIGATTTPGRVLKGKKMAGRMGGKRVTSKNLLVCRVDAEQNILYVCGAVPGSKGSLLTLQKAR